MIVASRPADPSERHVPRVRLKSRCKSRRFVIPGLTRDPFQTVDDLTLTHRRYRGSSEANGHFDAEEWIPGQAREDQVLMPSPLLHRNATRIPLEPRRIKAERAVRLSTAIGDPAALARSQAWPASTARNAGSMPRRPSARLYLASRSVSKTMPRSALQVSQPLAAISSSSCPGAQPE